MSDPIWYKAELDPELGINIPVVGTWGSVVGTLESKGMEVLWVPRMIDIAPWIDGAGRVYSGRWVSTGEWAIVDSATRKIVGSVDLQDDKKYLEYKGGKNER